MTVPQTERDTMVVSMQRLAQHLAKFRANHGNGLANVIAACLTWERRQRMSARAAFVALRDMQEP